MGIDELAARWRSDLEDWAIPPEILAQAQGNPWTYRVDRFKRRAEMMLAQPGPTHGRAREALPGGGSVLDVGAGAGAASLPVKASRLIAVDESAPMLAQLEESNAGAASLTLIQGRWPDVADQTPVADVAVCAHVVFNVPDLVPFLAALTGHARRRVVIELPERHPTTWLSPLWKHFHGLVRPDRPTWRDVEAIASAMGFGVRAERHIAQHLMFDTVEELAAQAGQRMCLAPDRVGEVIEAARDLGVWPVPPRRLVTLWWDVP